MASITRRGFVAGSALSAGLVAALAGCNAAGTAADPLAAPAADKYPIDPDKEGAAAKYSTEEVRDGWTRVTNEGGATLGVMDTAKIIQVDGLAFKDLNGNGKLDLYEDWRQPADVRARALAEMMSSEECVNLMWHGGTQPMAMSGNAETEENAWLLAGSRAGVSRLASTKESYASDIQWINGVQETCENSTYGIPYMNSTDPYDTLGIPSTIGLTACMDKDLWRKAGMWTGRAWRATGVSCHLGPQVDLYTNPITKRLAGAETEDPALGRDFTAAFGGGMQSTWGDDEATDDLGWGKDSVGIMLKHYVGAGAIETGADDHNDQGKYNVFPGDNFNAHLVPFVDGGMHLDSKTGQMAAVMTNYGIPYDEDEKYGELVAGAYNKHNVSILRNAGWDGVVCTDWGVLKDGDKTWGVEALSQPERFEKMLEVGIDQIGGDFFTDDGNSGVALYAKDKGDDEALARVRDSARRVCTFMMNAGLFEQPYCEVSAASAIFSSEAAADFAAEVNDRCVVMLKNSGNAIAKDGMKGKPKVYIPQKYVGAVKSTFSTTPASIKACFDESVASEYFDVVTDHVTASEEPTEADVTRLSAEELADVEYAVVKVRNPQDAFGGFEGGKIAFVGDTGIPLQWHPVSLQYRPYTADGPNVRKVSLAGDILEDGTKQDRGHFGKSTHATNESDLDLVMDIKSKLPETAKLILVVDADHPMVFSEIEPYADAIVLGWDNITDEAFAHIIAGEVEPSGLLQFQMPASMDTVEAQDEDVPRDMECYVDADGNTYDFCFGLNWSGVIDDERTKTYKAAPLTGPETCEVKADK